VLHCAASVCIEPSSSFDDTVRSINSSIAISVMSLNRHSQPVGGIALSVASSDRNEFRSETK